MTLTEIAQEITKYLKENQGHLTYTQELKLLRAVDCICKVSTSPSLFTENAVTGKYEPMKGIPECL